MTTRDYGGFRPHRSGGITTQAHNDLRLQLSNLVNKVMNGMLDFFRQWIAIIRWSIFYNIRYVCPVHLSLLARDADSCQHLFENFARRSYEWLTFFVFFCSRSFPDKQYIRRYTTVASNEACRCLAEGDENLVRGCRRLSERLRDGHVGCG